MVAQPGVAPGVAAKSLDTSVTVLEATNAAYRGLIRFSRALSTRHVFFSLNKVGQRRVKYITRRESLRKRRTFSCSVR